MPNKIYGHGQGIQHSADPQEIGRCKSAKLFVNLDLYMKFFQTKDKVVSLAIMLTQRNMLLHAFTLASHGAISRFGFV
jgi:hypothetical protein